MKLFICRLRHIGLDQDSLWLDNSNIDNKTQVDAILLDFTKALDKVPHKHLIKINLLRNKWKYPKLNKNNFYESICIKNRCLRQQHLLDNTCVTFGVLYRSVLGAVLFLLCRIYKQQHSTTHTAICWWQHHISQNHIWNWYQHHPIWPDQTTNMVQQMEFNISKCVHLPVTNKIKPS